MRYRYLGECSFNKNEKDVSWSISQNICQN